MSRQASADRGPIATRWLDLPDEDVRPGVRRCAIGTPDVTLVMNYIAPDMVGHAVYHFAPQRADYVHLLSWMSQPSE